MCQLYGATDIPQHDIDIYLIPRGKHIIYRKYAAR